MYVTDLFDELKQDKAFMAYFPDIFWKRTPPRDYFWKVFSVVRKQTFNEMVKGKLDELMLKRKIKADRFLITGEAKRILDTFNDNNNIGLLRGLSSEAEGGPQEGTEPRAPGLQA